MAEYWHIGAMTIRLLSSMLPTLSGVNSFAVAMDSRIRSLIGLMALAAFAASLPSVSLAQQQSSESDPVPHFEFAIDPAARTAGLKVLRTMSPRRGEREIRVWTGFGLGIPHDLIRLRNTGRTVDGAVIYWWDHGGEWGPDDNPESMHALVVRRYGCGKVRSAAGTDACAANLRAKQADWRRLFSEVDSLGAFGLRNPTDNRMGFDGFHVVIEILDENGYRTAYFANPSDKGGDDARRVLAILGAFERFTSRTEQLPAQPRKNGGKPASF